MEHINIVDMVSNVTPIIGFLALQTCQEILINKDYKLYQTKPNQQLILFDTPKVSLTSTHIDNEHILNNFHGDFVLECVHKLIASIPKDNLRLFYRNINESQIEHKEFKPFNFKHRSGYYSAIANKIKVQEKDYQLIIPHELFHLASSYYDVVEEIIYSGFRQYSYNTDISFGRGFNEGYTQHLTNKYFFSSNSYQLESHFAFLLEIIVGSIRMKEFYFNADVKGLINCLTRYEDEETVIKFIDSFDHLNVFKNRSSVIRSNVDFIVDFLINCYIKQLKTLVLNDELDPLEMYTLYSSYLEQMGSTMKIRKKNYCYFDTSKLLMNLNSIGEIVKQKKLVS